jgi:hypothetical protein
LPDCIHAAGATGAKVQARTFAPVFVIGNKYKYHLKEIVNLIHRHLLKRDNLNRIIGKVTFSIRVALVACIFLSAAALIMTSFANGEPDNIGAFFFFAVFYSIIWGTIPSMVLLILITLDNRYRKKTRLQPTRTEVKLLIINIAIILMTVLVIGLIRINASTLVGVITNKEVLSTSATGKAGSSVLA